MSPEPGRWIRLLLRLARLRASEAELGDICEEFGTGTRSWFWFVRQLLSTLRRPQTRRVPHGGRRELLSSCWEDIRYALQVLRRNPGFAVAVVAPVALGIGINTGVFSILNNVAFRPLPLSKATELVTVYQDFHGVRKRRVHGARMMFSTPEYVEYRNATRTLSGVAAYSSTWPVTLAAQSPQDLEGVLVSCNYFDVLQLRPAVGPGFTPANCDDRTTQATVVLGHALWRDTFAADTSIVGRTITLDGQPVTVVGVGPEGFAGIDLMKAALFTSTSFQPTYAADPQLSWLTLVGRRRVGVVPAQIRAELTLIAGAIDRQQPGRTTTLTIVPSTTLTFPIARREFFNTAAVIMAAFGLVLLIACANVGNVLLARAAGRAREIAIRLSVGATRGRMVRQLLTESLTIAITGSIAGVLLGWWVFQTLLTRLPVYLPGDVSQMRLDAVPNLTVLWFAVGLTVVTAAACGLVPAIQATRSDLHTAMKQDGSPSSRGAGWLRGTLIAAQIAVCMVLLVSGALLLRALHAAHTIDPGFEYRDVVVVSYSLRGPGYEDARVVAFQRELIDRLRSLPRVDGVAVASKVPLSPGRQQTAFRLPRDNDDRLVEVNSVSPEYFTLLGIPIVRGRTFTAADVWTTPRLVVVSEATARRFWPGQDPTGQFIFIGANRDSPVEVVGVVRDAHVSHLAETESSYLYLPAGPSPERNAHVLVRSESDFASLATGISGAARALDPNLIVRVNPLEDNLEYWRARSRLTAGLSSVLGLMALLLAIVGVYGIVAYVASRRRREIGIRLTLGATAGNIQRLIVRQTLRPVVIGAVIGLVAAGVVSRVLDAVLFGISPFDPIAFVGAAVFLGAVAGLAALLPTRKALDMDPSSILRAD